MKATLYAKVNYKKLLPTGQEQVTELSVVSTLSTVF